MKRILFFLIPLLYISSAHALPECPDSSEKWSNCWGIKTYPPNDYYVGEWRHGERFWKNGLYVKELGEGLYEFRVSQFGQDEGTPRLGIELRAANDREFRMRFWLLYTFFGWNGDPQILVSKSIVNLKSLDESLEKLGVSKEFVYHAINAVLAGLPIRRYIAMQEQGVGGKNELLQASSGSAFAVSRDGYLVTNNHVINGCEKVAIHSDGVTIPVSIVTYDLQNDLALLKGQFSPTHVFPIRKSNPALLEDVYVAGFPFGEKYSSSIKVTKGIISALTGVGNNFSNFQIDAALQPGNSGGPILDENGNVIGVAVAKLDMKYALENWGALPENINFGIKSNVVMSVLESQRVNVVSENSIAIDKRKLGEQISVGTYYVSCWMTTAQIEQMREKKVMFENIK